MVKKIHHKLVRDNVPKIITQSGAVPKTRTLSAEAFKVALLEKLIEEATEARDANGINELAVELADVEEVLLAILEANDIDREQFEKARKQRARVRGAFTKKIFLDSVETR